MKPPDTETVPLCAYHHKAYHRLGRWTFEAEMHVNLDAELVFYRAASGMAMP